MESLATRAFCALAAGAAMITTPALAQDSANAASMQRTLSRLRLMMMLTSKNADEGIHQDHIHEALQAEQSALRECRQCHALPRQCRAWQRSRSLNDLTAVGCTAPMENPLLHTLDRRKDGRLLREKQDMLPVLLHV